MSRLQLVLSRVDKLQAIAAAAKLAGKVADASLTGVGEATVGGAMSVTQSRLWWKVV